MSGVFKSIKKVFRKVVKVVKKVAPVVLAAAAIYFTASGAMSGSGYGGWGAAVSQGAKNVAGTGLLGDVLAGAATQAGYGAIAGGLVSGLSGGSISDGMASGALMGGVAGGVGGAFGAGTSALPSQLGAPAVSPAAAASPAAGSLAASGAAPAPAPGVSGMPAPVIAAAPSSGGVASGFLDYAKSEGGGKFLGSLANGIGGGLIAGQSAQDNADAIGKAAAQERAAIAANYGVGAGGGLMTAEQLAALKATNASRGGMLPTEKFDPVTYGGGGDAWQFNPQTGRIESKVQG